MTYSPFRQAATRLTSSTTNSNRSPNRMTSAFNAMKETCPDDIRIYGKCIANHHRAGNLDKGSCDPEFLKVQECFSSVRHQ